MTNQSVNPEERTITLGELSIEEEGIPTLEISSFKAGVKGRHIYHLKIFRAYGSKVSETKDGQPVYGTTTFIGLKDITSKYSFIGLQEVTEEQGIEWEIYISPIMELLKNHAGMTRTILNPDFIERRTLEAFAKASHEWVTKAKESGE